MQLAKDCPGACRSEDRTTRFAACPALIHLPFFASVPTRRHVTRFRIPKGQGEGRTPRLGHTAGGGTMGNRNGSDERFSADDALDAVSSNEPDLQANLAMNDSRVTQFLKRVSFAGRLPRNRNADARTTPYFNNAHQNSRPDRLVSSRLHLLSASDLLLHLKSLWRR